MTSVLDQSIVRAGAWYKARDVQKIREVFGYAAAQYLRQPRRVGRVIHNKHGVTSVQFQTMGDKSRAIGMNGAFTNSPKWNVEWLEKVKDPCGHFGMVYEVSANWRAEALRRWKVSSQTMRPYLKQEFAGKTVTASHESYSGYSLWVRNDKNEWACIPKMYLREPAPDRIAKMISETPGSIDYLGKKKIMLKPQKTQQELITLKPKSNEIIQFANGQVNVRDRVHVRTHNGPVHAPVVSINTPLAKAIEDASKAVEAEKVKKDLIDLGIFPKNKGTAALKKVEKEEETMSIADSLDSKVRMLESRVRELESEPVYKLTDEDFVDEDPENDLDHSMVLDLPPNIAAWAKEAGVGLDDMLPLATEIVKLQSEMTAKRISEIETTERAKSEYECSTQARIQETERVNARSMLAEQVSQFRHQTLQTLIRWGAGAGTISYLAHQASGLFF